MKVLVTAPHERVISGGILGAMARRLDAAFKAASVAAGRAVSERIGDALRASPETQSLLTGELWHEMGVANPQRALDDIIDALAADVSMTYHGVRIKAGSLAGGFTIGILRRDYSGLLGLGSATFRSKGGHRIDWLDWLLTGGDTLLVSDYEFRGGFENRSRTGYGVMLKGSGGWRVPSPYQGTQGDNWITRAVEADAPNIRRAIAGVIRGALSSI